MKLYLSSFLLGDKAQELPRLMGANKKIAYIPNAGDYTGVDFGIRSAWEQKDIQKLEELGLSVEYVNLQDYFHKKELLQEKLSLFGGVFVRGGNTFILRQAMRLSGFDEIFQELLAREDFVYAGYSAGICVLAPRFDALQIVDDPSDKPYPELQETLWEGLAYFDHILLPHYKSDHHESTAIDQEVAFCQSQGIPFRTLRDGEVIVVE